MCLIMGVGRVAGLVFTVPVGAGFDFEITAGGSDIEFCRYAFAKLDPCGTLGPWN